MAQIGTVKIQTQNGIEEIPVFEISDVGYSALRVQTPNGIGAINLVDPSNADMNHVRVQTPNGVKAVSTSTLISNGLITRYRFENNGDNTVYDYTGNHNGSLSGASYTTSSQEGSYALNFSSDNDEVAISSHSDFANLSAFTIVHWAYPRTFNSSNWKGVTYHNGTSSNRSLTLHLGGHDGDGTPDFHLNGNKYSLSTSVSTNTWTHCAFTWDGSTIRMYKNGSFVESNSVSESGPGDSSYNVQIGEGPYSDWAYDGRLDDWRFYNRQLSESEINEIYNGNG